MYYTISALLPLTAAPSSNHPTPIFPATSECIAAVSIGCVSLSLSFAFIHSFFRTGIGAYIQQEQGATTTATIINQAIKPTMQATAARCLLRAATRSKQVHGAAAMLRPATLASRALSSTPARSSDALFVRECCHFLACFLAFFA